MKIALTDIETTGLDPLQHEIIEIGLIVFDSETFEIHEEWEQKIKPMYPQNGSPEAFKCNGYNETEWYDAPLIAEAMEQYAKRVSNARFCAHNVTFDWGFINQASIATGIQLPFHYQKIDTLSMAHAKLPHIQSFRLKNLCNVLGIPPEPEIHRAINGARCAYEVYKKLMS